MSNHDEGRYWQRRREDAGLEQSDVAERLGLHRVTLSRYESGARAIPASVKAALAALYDMQGPAGTESSDYWRGVMDTANAVREALAAFERRAADAAVIAAASADDAGSPPPVGSSRPDTAQAGRRTALRLERSGSDAPSETD